MWLHAPIWKQARHCGRRHVLGLVVGAGAYGAAWVRLGRRVAAGPAEEYHRIVIGTPSMRRST